MQNIEKYSPNGLETEKNNISEIKNLSFGYTKDSYSIKELSVLAEMYARSGYFPKSGNIEQAKAQAFTLMHSGLELGLPPSVAIRNIYFYNGNLEMRSQLALMLVKRHPEYDYRVLTSINSMHQECKIEFFQNGKSLGVSNFTIEMADKAGLVKPNSGYMKYPHAMLFARSVMLGIRLYCADIGLGNVYYRETLPDGTIEHEIGNDNFNKQSHAKKPEIKHEYFKDDAIKEYQKLQTLINEKKIKPETVFPKKLWNGLLKYYETEMWQNVLNGSRYLISLLAEFKQDSNSCDIDSKTSNQDDNDKIPQEADKSAPDSQFDQNKADYADVETNIYEYLENSIDKLFANIEPSKQEEAWERIKPTYDNLKNTVESLNRIDDSKSTIKEYIKTIESQFKNGGILK
jgi:hypothetical protein